MADLQDLPKMEATIAETLRLCPASPLLMKANCETAMLRDYLIPANTMIMVNVYHINRDPQVFPDPDTFNPWRWITEDGKFRGELLDKTPTFGVGRRACIGRPLARMELFLLLCRLMQTFAFTVPEGHQRPSGSMVGVSVTPGPPSYMLKLEIRA
jgi:cytochrome P450